MELIDTMLIERIRKALIKRYDRDQQIQQMIEEIGAEEGLNETELSIVYQAYLEVKERVYYTSSLVDLWNQIEDVQKRMALLHSYESLEEDLFGDVLGDDKEDIVISNTSELGKGASYNDDAYAMEQVQLSDVPVHHDSTVGMNHIKLNELKSIGGLFTGFGESSGKEIADFEDTAIEHLDVKPLEGVESLAIHHLDEDEALDVDGLDELSKHKKSEEAKVDDEDMSSIDPYTAVNALLFGKAGLESDKTNKKMEKLLKKQLKRVDDEWARINGTDDTSKKSKDYKKFKEDKKSKGDKKSKDDKKSKEDKKDKKHKKSKEDKHSKSEDKLKKKKDKAEKKLKVLNDKLKTVFLGDTFSKKDKNKDKKKDKKSKKDKSEKKQKR